MTGMKISAGRFVSYLISSWCQVAGDALERSLRVEGELDARFLLLCTPQLEHARQALPVHAQPHP